RNNYTGNTPKGDAIWVSRPGGYPYGRPDSVKFDIMYKYNVDLNIDKNPFGLELEYSITDGTNTYKSNANGEISIPNTTNANYKALIYEVGSENPFCSIDLTPGNYKHSTLGAEHPYEINVEKVSEYKTQMTISYYNYGDINLNSKLDTEDISLLTAYLLSGYNFIQTGSSNDLILGKSGSNITINGDISANGDFKLWKNNANINGVLSAKNYWENGEPKGPENFPSYFNQIDEFITEYFDDQYMTKTFFSKDVDIFDCDTEFINNNINVNNSTFVDGNALLRGNVNINSNFKATNNINIEGNVQNTSGYIIYSETGDITLGYKENYSANINFNGFIYAPNGKVTIKGDNINITGTIIAKEIIIEGNSINFNVGALNQIPGFLNPLSLTKFQLLLADVNNNNIINIYDLSELKKKLFNQDLPSTLSISNVTNIPNITEGEAVSIAGLITSNYNITSVTVGVYSAESGGTAYTSASATPNATSYNISALDAKILFNNVIGGGTRYFRIVAKDSSGKEKIFVQPFTVTASSTLSISNVTTIPNITEGEAVSIAGEITSNYNITSVTVGVYSAESGGTAYTSASATPNATSYNISALDAKILFNNVTGGGTRYFRIVAIDSSGKEKILVNQPFTVTKQGITTPTIQRMIDNIQNSSNINKKTTCTIIARVMLNEGYEPALVAGMLANICSEGEIGQFEYYNNNSPQSYIVAIPSSYNYRVNYSGKRIYDSSINFNTVYNMVSEMYSKGATNIFGLGCVQWTSRDRIKPLVDLYKQVNGGRSTITFDEVAKAEGVMIARELNGSYKYIYTSWKSSNLSNLDSQTAAYNAGYDLCMKYEVPANRYSKAPARGDLAKAIYIDMVK
ncbi:MAG: hypothetical protein GX288_02155, partial [Clostridiales bacterium]|nr:hypothetical protein [Clostridiales bacterium]